MEVDGLCKLWIVDEMLIDEALTVDSQETLKAHGPHAYVNPDTGQGCATCGQADDNWRHQALSKGAEFVAKADTALRYTLGPMYVPDALDAHDEWTDANELQSAVWKYVQSGDRQIRLQHNREIVAGEWVECMAWPWEVTVPMTTADGLESPRTFPANTVFLGVQWEPWAWELVKGGQLNGYSIGGKAERVLADLPNGQEQS